MTSHHHHQNWKTFVLTLPLEARPRIIQKVKHVPQTMNHTYFDCSKVPPPGNYTFPQQIADMTFAEKIYDMLSQPQYDHCIEWMPHGRAFKVTVPKSFEAECCPRYFGHSRYSTFLRDLNRHSFKHISRGQDRNCKYKLGGWVGGLLCLLKLLLVC